MVAQDVELRVAFQRSSESGAHGNLQEAIGGIPKVLVSLTTRHSRTLLSGIQT